MGGVFLFQFQNSLLNIITYSEHMKFWYNFPMNTTIILSQILGIVITIFGLSVLVNRKSVIALSNTTNESYGIVWILGFITLVSGALIITFNSGNGSHLQVLIQILGWLTLAKGVVTLLFPEFTISMYKKWVKGGVIILSGLVTFVLGVALLYLGFF